MVRRLALCFYSVSGESPRKGPSPEYVGRLGKRRIRGWRRELLEFAVILLVAFGLIFGVVRPVIAEPFKIPSESMVPTLEGGDRVLANKLVYDFEGLERGDVVVFDVPYQKKPLIKRVVGLPGDRIEVRQGKLLINGVPQNEPYIVENPCVPYRPNTCSYGPITVLPNHFFAMGDNRAYSNDSRFIGPVPQEDIEGKASLKFWPPDRVGGL